jgi:hypothetical protein
MAAVFALIFLPVLASVGLMIQVFRGQESFGSALAMICFTVMAAGVFVGLFNMARRWENEPNT